MRAKSWIFRWRPLLMAAIMGVIIGCAGLGRAAAASRDDLTPYKVLTVIDGDTLRLVAKDGAGNAAKDEETAPFDLRLVGVQAPKLSLGRDYVKDWPLAHESRQFLEDFLAGHEVVIKGPRAEDRHGRVLAQAYLADDDNAWIQGEMIRNGWARVYSLADHRHLWKDLLPYEKEARLAKRGLWAHAAYQIYNEKDLTKAQRNHYVLVTGRPVDFADFKDRAYLNFGDDYRTDFTIQFSRDALKLWRKDKIDPAQYVGKDLRIHGWLDWYQGPMIRIDFPEQIEILD